MLKFAIPSIVAPDFDKVIGSSKTWNLVTSRLFNFSRFTNLSNAAAYTFPNGVSAMLDILPLLAVPKNKLFGTLKT